MAEAAKRALVASPCPLLSIWVDLGFAVLTLLLRGFSLLEILEKHNPIILWTMMF